MLPLHQAPMEGGQTAYLEIPQPLSGVLRIDTRFRTVFSAAAILRRLLSVRDSNPEPTGYEPAALTNCANGHRISGTYLLYHFQAVMAISDNKISGLFFTDR